ncbi:unnamed protein product [Symbiodinium natans]|uniref:Uncharacterized protein n=1 Tax=Symbiodinium natans TaxID=878477 RepID=A0A812KFC7_9DINO|nr:unnamed protein product [Symbiodinium natans]
MKRGASAIFSECHDDKQGDTVSKALKQHDIEDSNATAKAPSGPSSLRDAFNWPVDMVAVILQDESRMARLKESLHSTWRLTSNYSGLCTEETAFQALRAGLRAHAEKLGLRDEKAEVLPVEFHSACDADGVCQGLALGIPGSRQAQHYFQQLDDVLVSEVQQELNAMEQSMPSIRGNMSKDCRAEVLQQRVDAYEAMGEYLLQRSSEPEPMVKAECFCVKHLQECRLNASTAQAAQSAQCSPGADAESNAAKDHSLEVAGLTCVAFSSYGKHEGLGHESMRPFYTWCVLMRFRRPLLLIMESASAFPKGKLQMFLEDLYHLEFVDHPGPCFHGWPIRRPRMYCLGFLRSQVTFVGSVAEYTALFRRTVEMDGNALFFLPHDHAEIVQEFQLLCKRRGFQMADEMSQQSWDRCYPANQQSILQQHRARMAKKHGDTNEDEAYILDLDQNFGFAQAGPWWPCVITHGTIHSLQKGRHATVSELFAAQGFPTDLLLKAPYSPAFLEKVQASIAERDPRWSKAVWHKMIGNAMFVPTLGSMILYALSSIEWQPATLFTMKSRLTFSFEDSQHQEDLTGEMAADAGF